jgi:hypothetical protein
MAAKTTGIASYFEDFCRHGSREGGLKMRCIICEIIFARALRAVEAISKCSIGLKIKAE